MKRRQFMTKAISQGQPRDAAAYGFVQSVSETDETGKHFHYAQALGEQTRRSGKGP